MGQAAGPARGAAGILTLLTVWWQERFRIILRMDKPLNWFEIPADDLYRAGAFYQYVFQVKLRQECIGPVNMAVFPYDCGKGAGGSIIQGPGYSPSREGALVYLNAEPSIDEALHRIAVAGGEITRKKTALPPGMGYFAHVIDCEGNRIGLHALK